MEKVLLGEILDVRRGASLSGEFYSTQGDKIRLTLGNFDYPNGGFKHNTSKKDLYFIGPINPKFVLKKGDIITPLTEQVAGLLGSTAVIPQDDLYIQSGDIGLVIPDETKLSKGFAYYLLSSSIIKKQLGNSAQQTKIRHTSPDAIKSCVAWIPSLEQQLRITNILGTIDKRLENIRKEMALFDKFLWDVFNYWFVQYDFPNVEGKPYKTNGGIFERSSELKQMIPKNWQCGNLYQIADFINGLACQKYRPKNGEFLPVIKIKEMHNGITNSTEKADRNVPEIYKIESGDILFSWSATLEIMYWFGGKGVLNQHIFKVVPKNIVMTDFAYRQIFKYITVFKKIAETRKTTMGHITSDHIKQSCIVIPPLEILTEYSNYIKPFIEKISKLNQELLQILSLKNTVLPLLMNGQIAVQ